jgi:hypothetical protein
MQDSTSMLVVLGTNVSGNIAASGGGAYVSLRAIASVLNSTVASNVALLQGGGLACMLCALLQVLAVVKDNTAREVRSTHVHVDANWQTLHGLESQYSHATESSSEAVDLDGCCITVLIHCAGRWSVPSASRKCCCSHSRRIAGRSRGANAAAKHAMLFAVLAVLQ